MSHFWVNTSGEWKSHPLPGDAFVLTGDALEPLRPREAKNLSDEVQLFRRKDSDGEKWFILARSQKNYLFINGIHAAAGLRILRDRDEIRAGECERMFFSTESLACVELFPGLDHQIFCPRCKQEIAPQTLTVKCPQCDAWYHQSDELPCWTYSERCSMCDQSSCLDAGYRWTPESL